MKAIAVAFVLAGAAEDDAEFTDSIVQNYGQPTRNLKIVEDSWKVVRAKVRGVAAEIPISANDVKDTEYGDAWPGFQAAKNDVLQGHYSRAIGVLDGLLKKVDEKPWGKQYLLYYGGLARLLRSDRGAKDFAQSRSLFDRLTKEEPGSRFLFEAYVGIADSYFYEQNWEEAEKAYKTAAEKLAEASRATASKMALSEFYEKKKWLAETKIAMSLEVKKDWAMAKIRYREIATSATKFGDVAAMANAGQGRCLVAAKEYESAVRFFEEMIKEAEDARQFDVLGGAYCGLGDAYFGKQEYLPAMWNYKRVTVMYFTEPQYAAKAHFRAGRCYETLGASEKNSLKFARRHYNKVLELFPDSPWKDEAEARLKAIGGAGPTD